MNYKTYELINEDLYELQKCLVDIDFILSSNEFHSIGPVVLIVLSAKTLLFLSWFKLQLFLVW